MSLPLHDCGSVKLPENIHSYLTAKSLQKRVDLTSLIRDIVVESVMQDFHTLTLADEIHSAKGLGKILGDTK